MAAMKTAPWWKSSGWTPSSWTTTNADAALAGCDGIIVPGGFGDRGIEGMVSAARYARTHHVPYFGICLGMQIAVMEYARIGPGLGGRHFQRVRTRKAATASST